MILAADCLQQQKTTSIATPYRQEETEDKDYKSCTTEDREDTASFNEFKFLL